MSVKIRLSRQGRKKAPFYRLVVADSRSPRDGKFIELVGTYNPMTDPAAVTINEERVLYWLKNGALPSDTARGLLRKQGILEKFNSNKTNFNRKEKDAKNITRLDIITFSLLFYSSPQSLRGHRTPLEFRLFS